MSRHAKAPFIMSLLLAMLLSLAFAYTEAAPAKDSASLVGVKIPAAYAYVGGYTSEKREGKARGIEVYTIDANGKWSPLQTVESTNPSFLAMDGKKRFLYSCQGDGTAVAAYAIDPKSGTLAKLNEKQASGNNGVHLAVSPDDRFLVVANYAHGSVDSFALNPDGSLGEKAGFVSTQGEGGELKSQKGSYPHQTVFSKDGRFVLVPDKGRDLVHIVAFDRATGALRPHDPPALFSRPAVGSRHMDFHPALPYAYVMEESDNSITVCAWDAKAGILKPLQWVPAIPDTYFPKEKGGNFHGSSGIAVAPSGKFLYVSNRGDDSIGIFAVNQKTGFLKPVAWEKTRGERPRFFRFDPSGAVLFAANERGNSIMAFKAAPQKGTLSWLGAVARPGSPTCILFK